MGYTPQAKKQLNDKKPVYLDVVTKHEGSTPVTFLTAINGKGEEVTPLVKFVNGKAYKNDQAQQVLIGQGYDTKFVEWDNIGGILLDYPVHNSGKID